MMRTLSPARPAAGSPNPAAADPLSEIDRLMERRSADEQRSKEESAEASTARSAFSLEFATACDDCIRPAMERVIERLRQNGGGGVIDERAEDRERHRAHRLTVWMSLHGEINGTPREDRLPYLRLDADANRAVVTLSEGDMWQGRPGHRSGKVGERQLSEITPALLTAEMLAVLRRSFE